MNLKYAVASTDSHETISFMKIDFQGMRLAQDALNIIVISLFDQDILKLVWWLDCFICGSLSHIYQIVEFETIPKSIEFDSNLDQIDF